MKVNLLFFISLVTFSAFGKMDFVPEGPNTGHIASERGTFKPPTTHVEAQDLNKFFFSEMNEQEAELKKVKFYLMNGETRMAQVYLQGLAHTQTKLRPLVHRYMGILAFIESKFQKSFDHLNLPELQEIPHYPKICTLKVLNMVVLNILSGLQDQWEKCQTENKQDYESWNVLWLDTLVKMKLRPYAGSTKVPFKSAKLQALEVEQLKVLLKLAIYLNQEKLVLNDLNELTVDQLQDEEVRELVGQIHFRSGSLAKSYRYIEDLTSPNAENIKGNLYILRNKYELAYAQFKLALGQKQNSQNAMERIIPLAWLLGDWEEGSKYAERVVASPQTQMNKLALVAAFKTQKGDFVGAKNILNNIEGRSRRGTYIDVTQLQTFVALMQTDIATAKKYAQYSCDQYDFVNCWVLFQLDQWDNFPLTLRRMEEIVEKRTWENLSDNVYDKPLKETVYVNQIDIEELDDRLIQLVPTSPKPNAP